jgi:FkbM family methyltransferase
LEGVLGRLKQKIANAVGSLVGAHIIPKGRVWEWPEAYFSREIMTRLEIDCVFDVGANVGQYAQGLRAAGFTGTILSFEPAPDVFAVLEREAQRDPHWHVFNYALGDEAAVIPFNVMKLSVLSSFLKPAAGDDRPLKEDNSIVSTTQVPVKVLDDIFDDLKRAYKFERPALKLDTQGYDLKVALGCGKAIDNFLFILTEAAMKLLYDGSPTLGESVDTFQKLGFDAIGFYSVHPGLIFDPHEFNLYLLRRDLAVKMRPA